MSLWHYCRNDFPQYIGVMANRKRHMFGWPSRLLLTLSYSNEVCVAMYYVLHMYLRASDSLRADSDPICSWKFLISCRQKKNDLLMVTYKHSSLDMYIYKLWISLREKGKVPWTDSNVLVVKIFLLFQQILTSLLQSVNWTHTHTHIKYLPRVKKVSKKNINTSYVGNDINCVANNNSTSLQPLNDVYTNTIKSE